MLLDGVGEVCSSGGRTPESAFAPAKLDMSMQAASDKKEGSRRDFDGLSILVSPGVLVWDRSEINI